MNRKTTSNSSNTPEQAKAESKIQQECVQWYRNNYCLKHHSPRSIIFSIPNEGRGAASAPLIATGLYPGCADLMVIHSRFRTADFGIIKTGIFIECKTDIGTQSDSQKEFEAHALSMEIPYFIVRTLEQFKQVIANL